jgi:hypothetical protein
MKLATIPHEPALALLRNLGLVMGQAGIYGSTHPVTQHAARAVFPELEQLLSQCHTLEITLRDKQILVNGTPLDVGGSSGKNLLDRMALHKVEGLAFRSPANRDEFLQVIALFGTPPLDLAGRGGLEKALQQVHLQSIQIISVSYRRISREPDADRAEAGQKPHAAAPHRSYSSTKPAVLELALTEETVAPATHSPALPPHAANHRQTAAARQQHASTLAATFRQAATLLEQQAHDTQTGQPEALTQTFQLIYDMLNDMTLDSQQHIHAVADQVKADRQSIAMIENSARHRGIGLQLTREELLTHYSELTQEIAQPLTVSNGVLELLRSGRTGALSESQQELLKMATESIARINKLVEHLNVISGVPATLIPDAQLLEQAYQQ